MNKKKLFFFHVSKFQRVLLEILFFSTIDMITQNIYNIFGWLAFDSSKYYSLSSQFKKLWSTIEERNCALFQNPWNCLFFYCSIEIKIFEIFFVDLKKRWKVTNVGYVFVERLRITPKKFLDNWSKRFANTTQTFFDKRGFQKL